MRASTIFALIVAVILGLGAVIAVKASGILTPAEPKKETPPSIVVAAANIFEGNVISARDVRLRPVRNDQELQLYREGKLLPPVTAAAVNRIAATDIVADTPLREELLQPLQGDDLGRQLLPCERAVTICIGNQWAAGGLIRVGDLVDVQLITTVEGCETGQMVSRTAVGAAQPTSNGPAAGGQKTGVTGTQSASAIIVRGARVIGRRTHLNPVDTPLGRMCCTNYTLAMNPYRAGLTEYCKDKGIIALLPVSRQERNQLMQQATQNLMGRAPAGDSTSDTAVIRKPEDGQSGDRAVTASYDRGDPYAVNPIGSCRFSIPGNPEYADEDQRVADFVAGLYTIGEHDLMRIFHLTCLQPPEPTPPVSVERVNGLKYVGDQVFDPRTGRSAGFMPVNDFSKETVAGTAYPQGVGRTPINGNGNVRYAVQGGQAGGVSPASVRFQPPGASGRGGCPTCPTCPKR